MSAHQQVGFENIGVIARNKWLTVRPADESNEKKGRRGIAGTWAWLFGSAIRERDLVSRDAFLRSVESETKRCERSGKQFALLLLRGAELSDSAIIRKLRTSICSVLRDIDVIGWYEEGSAIGIICREIGLDSAAASRAIVARIESALQKSFGSKQGMGLSVTWHLFANSLHEEKETVAESVRCETTPTKIERQRTRHRDVRNRKSVSQMGVARPELS